MTAKVKQDIVTVVMVEITIEAQDPAAGIPAYGAVP